MKVAARVRHAAATLLRLLRGRTVLASTRSAPPSPDTVAGGGGGSNLLLFLLLLSATFLLMWGKFSSDSKEAHFLFFMRHSSSWRRGHSKRRQGRTDKQGVSRVSCLVSVTPTTAWSFDHSRDPSRPALKRGTGNSASVILNGGRHCPIIAFHPEFTVKKKKKKKKRIERKKKIYLRG